MIKKIKRRRNKIAVKIDIPILETSLAIKLIKKLALINNLRFNLTIAYNYGLKDCGEYRPYEKISLNCIYVNPLMCGRIHEESPEPFCPGYVSDMTLFGVTIHEFCHYTHFRLFPNMLEDYKKQFPTERFYLNCYSNNELMDELAETMTLYITNPYLLRLISKKHWYFFKQYFISPVACTFSRCKYIFSKFPIEVKEHCKKKFGIVYNISDDTFDKIDNKIETK